ncbi:hypothetical protein C8F01DRAFT_226742 [Mycena amicta]|nr:hypothetical protein C8F01DRAFT_226742 [Mycena amicta]
MIQEKDEYDTLGCRKKRFRISRNRSAFASRTLSSPTTTSLALRFHGCCPPLPFGGAGRLGSADWRRFSRRFRARRLRCGVCRPSPLCWRGSRCRRRPPSNSRARCSRWFRLQLDRVSVARQGAETAQRVSAHRNRHHIIVFALAFVLTRRLQRPLARVPEGQERAWARRQCSHTDTCCCPQSLAQVPASTAWLWPWPFPFPSHVPLEHRRAPSTPLRYPTSVTDPPEHSSHHWERVNCVSSVSGLGRAVRRRLRAHRTAEYRHPPRKGPPSAHG